MSKQPIRFWSISAIFFLLIISACEKNKYQDIESDGTGTALLNGQLWDSKIRLTDRGSHYHLHFQKLDKISGEWYPTEELSVFMVNKSDTGRIRIHQTSDQLYNSISDSTPAMSTFGTSYPGDWDVICDSYEINEKDSVNNWVRIDRVVGDYEKVYGSFSLHFYRAKACSESERTDTLLFTNGQFEVTF